MVLKQVANFYNTIHTQMIASQNGMLVDAAKQFEQVSERRGRREKGEGRREKGEERREKEKSEL